VSEAEDHFEFLPFGCNGWTGAALAVKAPQTKTANRKVHLNEFCGLAAFCVRFIEA